jgi:hypothetical protein
LNRYLGTQYRRTNNNNNNNNNDFKKTKIKRMMMKMWSGEGKNLERRSVEGRRGKGKYEEYEEKKK